MLQFGRTVYVTILRGLADRDCSRLICRRTSRSEPQVVQQPRQDECPLEDAAEGLRSEIAAR